MGYWCSFPSPFNWQGCGGYRGREYEGGGRRGAGIPWRDLQFCKQAKSPLQEPRKARPAITPENAPRTRQAIEKKTGARIFGRRRAREPHIPPNDLSPCWGFHPPVACAPPPLPAPGPIGPPPPLLESPRRPLPLRSVSEPAQRALRAARVALASAPASPRARGSLVSEGARYRPVGPMSNQLKPKNHGWSRSVCSEEHRAVRGSSPVGDDG